MIDNSREKFYRLANYAYRQYEVEFAKNKKFNISSFANPQYQMIVGMGPAALPYIFRDIRSGGKIIFWMWALFAITGNVMLKDSVNRNKAAATKYWLKWADKNGYPSETAKSGKVAKAAVTSNGNVVS